jgi:N-acyl-D-amino-acid deacylase
LTVHIRNEGDGLIEAVAEALEIAAEAGVRLQLSHHKAVGRDNWGKLNRTLEMIEAARRQGLDLGLDLWPYTSGSTTITALLPGWILEGGRQAALDRLAIPDARRRARDQITAGALEGEALLRAVGFEGIVIAECPSRRDLEGRSLAEILGGDAWEGFFNLLVEIGLEATMIIRDELSEEDLRTLIRRSLAHIGSDSWLTSPEAGGRPHPRAYGAMTRFLRRYVLDQGLLTLEEGIRRITGGAARRVGLDDRGLLQKELAADVVVFDPEALRDRATFEAPHTFSEGIRHLVINGQVVLRDGEPQGVKAGQLLRRGRKPLGLGSV